VPPIAESYPEFEAYAWWGVFAPAGTPKAIVSRFADELAASLREPGVAKQLNETQQVTIALGGPEELRKFVSEQMRLWGRSRATTTSERIEGRSCEQQKHIIVSSAAGGMNGASERTADAIVSDRGVVQVIPRHECAR
jgi:hypothetical protein